jgi:hypothetical protein
MTWTEGVIVVSVLGLIAVCVMAPDYLWRRRGHSRPCQWCAGSPADEYLCALYTATLQIPIPAPSTRYERHLEMLFCRGSFLCKGCMKRAFERQCYLRSHGKGGKWD